jgi:hypothetical protein
MQAVLVFADGFVLDLDHRTIVGRPIHGQRPGDQRWDIVRAGSSLVVGWGEVWADPIAGQPPRRLGQVVTYVPAADRNAVWLIDYPGGRIGEGTPTLSEVTVTGKVLHTELGPPPSSGVPVVGVPGGLAFQTSTGIAFWDADQHMFTRRLGTEAGFIGNAAVGKVAWCEGLCTSLHVTALAGADTVFSLPQPGWSVQPTSAQLSPDGRYVAVITTSQGPQTAHQPGTLDIIDTRTGRVDVVQRHLSAFAAMNWTSDSRTLFFASDQASGISVGEVPMRTQRAETADVPIQSAQPFVIVNRSDAGSLLRAADHETPLQCSAMLIALVPSGACSYGY